MDKPAIVVRGQEPEDIPDLTELFNQPQVIWGTLQLPFVSVDARRSRSAAQGANVTRLVAVVEGKVVGAIFLTRYENRRAHDGKSPCDAAVDSSVRSNTRTRRLRRRSFP